MANETAPVTLETIAQEWVDGFMAAAICVLEDLDQVVGTELALCRVVEGFDAFSRVAEMREIQQAIFHRDFIAGFLPETRDRRDPAFRLAFAHCTAMAEAFLDHLEHRIFHGSPLRYHFLARRQAAHPYWTPLEGHRYMGLEWLVTDGDRCVVLFLCKED